MGGSARCVDQAVRLHAVLPRAGVGGHCLPIDPTYLSWHAQQATGRRFRLVELANDINEHMPDHVVQRVMDGLNRRGRPVRGSTILLLGLAYKKNSSDVGSPRRPASRVRSSPSGHGSARSTRTCPRITWRRRCPASALDADVVRAADAVVVLTDHDDIDYRLVQREARWILDCRNRLSGANVESL